MTTAMRASATLVVLLFSLNVLPDEGKAYCTAELGQVLTNSTDVFDGHSWRAAAGYKFTRKFGFEVSYEVSQGGTAKDDFWRTTEGPTRFDDVHMISIFGLVEWETNSRLSFFTKFGVARGKADFSALDLSSSPSAGTMTENNLVVVLGAAVPMSSSYDFTISVKQQMSANVFGIGDSLDSTTVSIGLRVRL